MQDLYQQAAAFHRVFDDRQPEKPTALSGADTVDRVGFILEELSELAAIGQTPQQRHAMFAEIHHRLDLAEAKLAAKAPSPYSPIVQQADALGDIAYLLFGSYVLMGVEPTAILAAIHSANMHKQFPDGTAHRDPVTHKVLKPADWAVHYQPEPAIAEAIARQAAHH